MLWFILKLLAFSGVMALTAAGCGDQVCTCQPAQMLLGPSEISLSRSQGRLSAELFIRNVGFYPLIVTKVEVGNDSTFAVRGLPELPFSVSGGRVIQFAVTLIEQQPVACTSGAITFTSADPMPRRASTVALIGCP